MIVSGPVLSFAVALGALCTASPVSVAAAMPPAAGRQGIPALSSSPAAPSVGTVGMRGPGTGGMRWTARLANSLSRELGIPVTEDQVRTALAKTVENRMAEDPQGSLSPAALIARAAGIPPATLVDGWVKGGSLTGFLASQGKGIPEVLAGLPDASQAAAQAYVQGLFTTPVRLGRPPESHQPVSHFARNLAVTLNSPKATPKAIEDVLRNRMHPAPARGPGAGGHPGSATRTPFVAPHGDRPHGFGPMHPMDTWGARQGVLGLVALDLGMTPQDLADRLKTGGTVADIAGPQAGTAEKLLSTQLQGVAEIRTVRMLGLHRIDMAAQNTPPQAGGQGRTTATPTPPRD